jgi:hypothetical protein
MAKDHQAHWLNEAVMSKYLPDYLTPTLNSKYVEIPVKETILPKGTDIGETIEVPIVVGETPIEWKKNPNPVENHEIIFPAGFVQTPTQFTKENKVISRFYAQNPPIFPPTRNRDGNDIIQERSSKLSKKFCGDVASQVGR